MVDANQMAKRVLVLTKQLGDVAGDIQKFVVQSNTDFAPQTDEEERLVRRDLEDDLADLVVQVKQLCTELGYSNAQYEELTKYGATRMERRKQEYIAKGWEWI